MAKRNPYTLNFGRIPNEYIGRDIIINEIVDTVNSEMVDSQAFKLVGIRGTGKTVTLTAIERELESDKRWIIVNLRYNADIIRDLISNLYSEIPFITKFVDANLNLSAFGIGLEISQKSPVSSMDVALKLLMEEIRRKKMRVLVTIDEVQKTEALIDFVQEFQILIRKDLPIYLIMAGLYEDIEDIENTDGLTFLLRAEKYEMKPLNTDVIRESYKETLKLSTDVANELATLTKGYAFAYQVIGYYMWESGKKQINDLILSKVDAALIEKVYEKIWSELRPMDKWFLSFIVKKDKMPVSELLELTKKNHNEWSSPRKRLIEKGVLEDIRGMVIIKLPRFKEYVESEQRD
ncbi:MAG: ATP-binding protein [Lachnospiraceae bacterium]|nr:ATP-binding protein [Lachnospiraceae bacterium]